MDFQTGPETITSDQNSEVHQNVPQITIKSDKEIAITNRRQLLSQQTNHDRIDRILSKVQDKGNHKVIRSDMVQRASTITRDRSLRNPIKKLRKSLFKIKDHQSGMQKWQEGCIYYYRQIETYYIGLYLSIVVYIGGGSLLVKYAIQTNDTTPLTSQPHHQPTHQHNRNDSYYKSEGKLKKGQRTN